MSAPAAQPTHDHSAPVPTDVALRVKVGGANAYELAGVIAGTARLGNSTIAIVSQQVPGGPAPLDDNDAGVLLGALRVPGCAVCALELQHTAMSRECRADIDEACAANAQRHVQRCAALADTIEQRYSAKLPSRHLLALARAAALVRGMAATTTRDCLPVNVVSALFISLLQSVPQLAVVVGSLIGAIEETHRGLAWDSRASDDLERARAVARVSGYRP